MFETLVYLGKNENIYVPKGLKIFRQKGPMCLLMFSNFLSPTTAVTIPFVSKSTLHWSDHILIKKLMMASDSLRQFFGPQKFKIHRCNSDWNTLKLLFFKMQNGISFIDLFGATIRCCASCSGGWATHLLNQGRLLLALFFVCLMIFSIGTYNHSWWWNRLKQ